jgi:hypothetical protein
MCRRHLLGEHVETHMMAGCLLAGRSLEGYYARGLIDTDLIAPRHTALAAEMAARGYRHESPLPDFPNPRRGRVAPASPEERCGRCRERAAPRHDLDSSLGHSPGGRGAGWAGPAQEKV